MSYNQLIIAAAPTGFWRLGEASGTVAIDEIGINDGTYVGSPTLDQPSLLVNDTNKSILFSGTGQYVDLTTNDQVYADMAGEFSCECIFDFQDLTFSNDVYPIVLAFKTSSTVPFAILLSNAAAHLDMTVGAGSATLKISTDLSGIFHCVITYASNTWRLYKNGVELSSVAGVPLGGNNDSIIGGVNPSSVIEEFTGVIDEVSVYDRVLSLAEIQQHYQEARILYPIQSAYEALIKSDAPLSYYRLSESVGNVAVDDVDDNFGTYENDPTLGVDGLVNSDPDTAVTFDGINDYVLSDATPDLDIFSIEFIFSTPSFGGGSETIVSKDAGAAGWALNAGQTTNRLSWWTYEGSWQGLNNSTDLSPNTTYHVVLTFDSVGNNKRMYINGALDTFDTASTILGTANKFTIGAGQRGALSPFTGIIDEVAIYNYELTSTQVSDHYDLISATELYHLFGTVTEDGSPVSRTVRAYDRTTGALVHETTSDVGDGSYDIPDEFVDPAETYYIIALDDAVAPDLEAIIRDRLIPVEV